MSARDDIAAALNAVRMPGPNLLPDPSFEAGNPGWTPAGDDLATLTVDTEHARTGVQSLKVQTPTSGAGPESSYLILPDVHQLGPDDLAQFTGWVWKSNPSGALIRVAGAVEGTNSNYVNDVGDWFEMTVTAPVVDPGSGLVLDLYNQSGTDPAWFDDLEVVALRPVVHITPHYRQALKPGQGFVRWARRDRAANGFGAINTWEVWIVLSQDNAEAERWIDDNLDALVDALDAEVTVTGVTANELALGHITANGVVLTGALGA